MKIAISLNIENMSALQNLSLVGIPGPVTVLSFIENLLIKTGLHNPEENSKIKVAYGIRNFNYSDIQYIRKLNNLDQDTNTNAVSEETYYANVSLQILFNLNTKMGEENVKNLLKREIPFLRFKGGMIVSNMVHISNNAESILFPTFMVYDSDVEFNNVDEFADLLSEFTLFPIIKGYQFLTDKKDITDNRQSVYSESCIGFCKTKALMKKDVDNLDYWYFENTNENIFIKTNKGV